MLAPNLASVLTSKRPVWKNSSPLRSIEFTKGARERIPESLPALGCRRISGGFLRKLNDSLPRQWPDLSASRETSQRKIFAAGCRKTAIFQARFVIHNAMPVLFISKKRVSAVLFFAALIALLGAAPTGRRTGSPSAGVPRVPAGIHFADVTQAAGIHFTHNNGAFGKKYLPETLGPGCAFIDYDNDGYPDILLVNGQDWPGHPASGRSTVKLFHNNRNGTFTDVTARTGLGIVLYGLGVAIGDYDNDGYDDIFITAVGQSHLFHNNGNGTFTDVTKEVGLWGINEFSTSAAWVDYDRDGFLDLVVGNYVDWSPQKDIACTLDGTHKSYCTPESYSGVSARVWHNLGGHKFEDATRKAGLYDPTSKTLGLTALDANGDGWPDLLLANDTQPNKLYINNRNGTFTEKGVQAGIAFSEDGIARAGMGVDAGDYDSSGRPSIIISNFSNQMMSLYHNDGNGLFVDEAPRSEIGRSSLVTLGFSCFFFDYDLDGRPDIFVAKI